MFLAATEKKVDKKKHEEVEEEYEEDEEEEEEEEDDETEYTEYVEAEYTIPTRSSDKQQSSSNSKVRLCSYFSVMTARMAA